MRKQTKTERALAVRSAIVAGSVIAAVLGASPLRARAADAKPPQDVQVTLSCAARVGKGRVLCDLDITAPAGRLTWADAIITKAPAFAAPLRDRIGLREATERSSTHLRLPFALIAQQPGEGEVTLKARIVWCKVTASNPERELCASVSQTISASIVVTQDTGSHQR
jgi:hypothetical protein